MKKISILFLSKALSWSFSILKTQILIGFLLFIPSLGGYVFCTPIFYRLSSFSDYVKTYEKISSSLWPHCNNHETLHHILSFSSVFLSQGRYTWRHNSVLNTRHLVLALGSAYSAFDTPRAPQIFADLPSHLSSSDSTIPTHVLPTSLRPDLVLLFPYQKIYILELTVPLKQTYRLLVCVNPTTTA